MAREEQQLLQEIKKEVLSLRKLVRQLLPIDDEPVRRTEWVDMRIAMARTGLTYRQLYNRALPHSAMKRTVKGVGLQIDLVVYREKYNSKNIEQC